MTTKAEALEAFGLIVTRLRLPHDSPWHESVNRVVDFINSTPEWQPIETAPLETDILIIEGSMMYVAHRQEGIIEGFWSHGYELTRINNPAAWMPLPTPPITGETK